MRSARPCRERFATWKGCLGALLLPLALALPRGYAAAAGADEASPSVYAPQRLAAHRRHRPSAEDRVKTLSKALSLDAAQESEVRRALQARREQIRQLLSQPADPNVPRSAAIHAINDRTAERIRAVLNEQQKKLYSQPLPRGPAPGKGKPGVEEWMNATRPKGN